MKRFRSYGAIAIPFTLLGCTVGPKYELPNVGIPCEWHSPIPEGIQTVENGESDCFNWWRSLNDPQLNYLIERMICQNLDLSIAAARIREARLLEKGAIAKSYPHIDGTAAFGHVQYDQKIVDRITQCHGCHSKTRQLNFYEAGFDAEWEIDLFGMNVHELNALKASTEASVEEYYQIEISLTAEVAKNYIELRGLQKRLDLINKNIASQEETLNLTTDLIETGFSNLVDQKQVEELLNVLLSQKPQIELSIQKTIHRLSILLGYAPGELFCELSEGTNLPEIPCDKPIGVPSELLRRRPDIKKAERDLAAATENVGVAVAALFPRFSLRGFIGDIGAASSNGFAWLAGPQLLLPILNSKSLGQDVDYNKIKAEEASYNYQKTVLAALEESENAIANYNAEVTRSQYLQKSFEASQEAYTLTKDLYENGFKGYLEVLLAKRSLIASEEAILQNKVDLLTDYIALYKSLGGVFE